ncbi:MAG: hypothetical protein RMJ43_13250 [Chloroherpetonaceae bacterium]|nr:hypothetical protein [Chthonomonadaceae bacterium]MDW8208794.1 hypothetical protein [Chloroherpetonaceae bacterium]
MTLQERRRREARQFVMKVLLLLTLIGGVAYGAWLAPAVREPEEARVERR